MKNRTIKYVIKVVPTFSQRLGQGILAMIGGAIGAIIFADFALKVTQNKKKKEHDDIKEFLKKKSEQIRKEEADKE